MPYTLLTLVDQVSGEMGLSQPTVVIGSAVNQTAQLLALCQRLGKDLLREYEWRRSVKAYVFQTTTAVSRTGTTTSASAVVTGLAQTSDLAVADVVSGTGIRTYSEILTIDSATQVTLNMPATASGSVTLTFAKQDYALPSDFDRMIADTHWDRNDRWMNLGTRSSQEWQTIQSGALSVGPRERYRIYNNSLRIFPALTTVYNMAYEYVSTYWVIASGGTAATKATATVDTDIFIWPDDLMMAGLKYYFLKAKKLEYGPEMADFHRILGTRQAQDQPEPARSLAPIRLPELITTDSLPEGSWS